MSNSTPIVEAEVINYLTNHPDFFNQHVDLVSSLNIPHQSGQAVSLVERQLQALRQSNSDLKQRFDQLMDVARSNEKHFENTKKFTLCLIDFHMQQGGLKELTALFAEQFPNILAAHEHRLVLVDYTGTELLPQNTINLSSSSISESAPKLQSLNKAFCGALTKAEKTLIFNDASKNLASFALIPLSLKNNQCFIAIGNREEKYFYKGMGTLFLDYIGELSERILTDILNKPVLNANVTSSSKPVAI